MPACEQCQIKFDRPINVKDSRRFCTRACGYVHRKAQSLERFLSRIKILDNGCWEFQGGSVVGIGYHCFRVNGIMRRVHCAAFELFIGPIPVGHIVRHSCDYPPCINPDHLLSGTQRQNIADMHARGRYRGGRHPGIIANRDSNNGRFISLKEWK